MSNAPYITSFSLKTLDHLGINLYGNAPAVIAELVANAHDAAAKRVDITVSPGRIVVQDDGVGMSHVDINTRYLRFGYEKRREVTIIPVSDGEHVVQRHVMGRKGIGKISALSIAREVEVQTAHGNERNGFIIDLDTIRQLQENNSTEYLPTPIPSSAISVAQGTLIELRQLVDGVTGLDSTLRETLARMFPYTGTDVLFDIYVNGSPITIADRPWYEKIQFMWYFGEDSKKFTEYCPRIEKQFAVDNVVDLGRGYVISGWLATTFFPSDVPVDQRIVPIYAQNKMIQRDLLYDYKNYKLSSSYLIGEINAPFMDVDTEPDIVLSDRQRINPNDPRYMALRQHVVQQVEAIDKKWNSLRNASPNSRKRKKKSNAPQPAPGIPEQPGLFDSPSGDDTAPSQTTEPLVEPIQNVTGNDTENGTDDRANGNQNSPSGNGVEPNAQQGSNRNRQPPAHEAQAAFSSIRAAIEASRLGPEFKRIILYDLEQAKFAYYAQVHKASVIMMGAVVEGLMKGTLYRQDILDYIVNDPNPPQIKVPGGLRHPDHRDRAILAQAMADELSFEDSKNIIQHYLPHIQHLGVPDIQRFRNAIHPWKCITEPELYSTYTDRRTLAHLMALSMITDTLLDWTP